MKNITHSNLFLAASLTLLVVVTLAAQANAQGAAFGTRDPLTCQPYTANSMTQDTSGKLFRCSNEVVTGDYIYLIENLTIQVGAARKALSSDSYHDLDPNAMVYPIRGSFTRYQCSKVFNIDSSHTNVGTNCAAYPQPRAEGTCYRTTFGDWQCKMFDRVTDSSTARMHVPPPK